MAVHAFTDVRVFLGGYDLSGDTNQVSLAAETEMLDSTVFGLTARRFAPGLTVATFDMSGFASVSDGDGDADDVLFDNVAIPDVPMTLCPDEDTAGNRAFMFRNVQAAYTPPNGTVGELAKFSAGFKNRKTRLVGGQMLHDADTVETATHNGTAVQVGAVGATQKLYAVLHVLAVSASDTLDVIVQSDDGSGFASPTTRVTFTQATAGATYQWATPVSGAITDTWWRVSSTLGGTGIQIQYAVAIGIL